MGWKLDRTLPAVWQWTRWSRRPAARKPLPGLVHHSDRGIQYASRECVAILRKHETVPSVSRPANPYDNASCESFIKTLKREEIYESAYRHWQQKLPESIEVLPVQLPGRGSRTKEPPYLELRPLIRAASEALAAETEKPFAFFGHSMGALIAFELARELRKQHGIQPVHLFISAKCSPRQRPEDPPVDQFSDAALIEGLERYEGTPQDLLYDAELLRLVLPVIRADMALCSSYVYEHGPLLECPITVFGGLEDHVSSRACLQSWQNYTKGPFTLRMLPGGHFFINSWVVPIFEVIRQELRADLRK